MEKKALNIVVYQQHHGVAQNLVPRGAFAAMKSVKPVTSWDSRQMARLEDCARLLLSQ